MCLLLSCVWLGEFMYTTDTQEPWRPREALELELEPSQVLCKSSELLGRLSGHCHGGPSGPDLESCLPPRVSLQGSSPCKHLRGARLAVGGTFQKANRDIN